jgi:hypothetical protein
MVHHHSRQFSPSLARRFLLVSISPQVFELTVRAFLLSYTASTSTTRRIHEAHDLTEPRLCYTRCRVPMHKRVERMQCADRLHVCNNDAARTGGTE